VVEETHNLENTRGAGRNNGGGIDTTRAEGNTKVYKGIGDRERNIIKGEADRGGGGRMVNDCALGGIPAVTKGKGVFSGKGEH